MTGSLPRGTLPSATPTSVVFLDETGVISQDRFFAMGALRIERPSELLRRVEKIRQRRSFHVKDGKEFKFSAVTAGTLPVYLDVIDAFVASTATFSAFVVDREVADAVSRFGNHFVAYQRLAAQLLLGTIRRREIVTVLADAYSTPDDVDFEADVRAEVNQRLQGRLAVSTVVRQDSRASDGLQVVDLLLGAVAHEFRSRAGLASGTEKLALSGHLRARLGIESFVPEVVGHGRVSVRMHLPERST